MAELRLSTGSLSFHDAWAKLHGPRSCWKPHFLPGVRTDMGQDWVVTMQSLCDEVKKVWTLISDKGPYSYSTSWLFTQSVFLWFSLLQKRLKPIILVSLGSQNKMTQMGVAWTTEIDFLPVPEARSPIPTGYQGEASLLGLQMVSFSLCPHVAFLLCTLRESSLVCLQSSYKNAVSSMRWEHYPYGFI